MVGTQARLEDDALPLSSTSGAAKCKTVVVLGSSQRGSLCLSFPLLQLHAKAVVANTCFPGHVSQLNKDYMYLIRIKQ